MLLECQRLANPENRGGAKVQAGSRENATSNYATIRIPGETAGKNPENCPGRFLPESRLARAKQKEMESQAVPSIPKIRESGSVHVARMPGSVHVAGKVGARGEHQSGKPETAGAFYEARQPGYELRPLFRKT